MGHTSSLQKDRPLIEHPALQPRHAIGKVIQPHLLSAEMSLHSRHGELALVTVRQRNPNHGHSAAATTLTLRLHVSIVIMVVWVIPEEPAAGRGGRFALHLTGEEAALVHGRGLAETIRDLARVNALECHSHTQSLVALRILD
jgi:hypothetical protein